MKVAFIGFDVSYEELIVRSTKFFDSQISVFCSNVTSSKINSGIYSEFLFFKNIEQLLEDELISHVYIFGFSASLYKDVTRIITAGINVYLESLFNFSIEEIIALKRLAGSKEVQFKIFFKADYLTEFQNIQNYLIDHENEINGTYQINIVRNQKNIGLNDYLGINKVHWAYSQNCGVFHEDIVNSLVLINSFIGAANKIDVIERCESILPQNLSNYLKINIYTIKATFVIRILINNDNDKIQFIGSDRVLSNDYFSYYHSNENSLAKKITKFIAIRNRKIKLKPSDSDLSSNELRLTNFEYANIKNIIENIGEKIKCKSLDFTGLTFHQTNSKNAPSVLITGATSQVGKSIIKRLVTNGYNVKAFIRKLSKVDWFLENEIDYCFGDIADRESLRTAIKGISIVVHAAANTTGFDSYEEDTNCHGTKNVIDLCQEYKIKKLIYISTINVYDIYHQKPGSLIVESSKLEDFLDRRGGYTKSKFNAEKLVREALTENKIDITILRPGTFVGLNGPFYTPIMGIRLAKNFFLVFGNGSMHLPLVFIENLSDAVKTSIESRISRNKIYNILDGLSMNKKAYIDLVVKKLYPHALFIYIPLGLMRFIVTVQEKLLTAIGLPPFLTEYRLMSSQNSVVYLSETAGPELNWKPLYSRDEAISLILNHKQMSGF